VSVAVIVLGVRELVLLHGFTQTGRSWAPVVAALQGRYRCFAPDLPGHGDADARRPATFDAVTAYLAALHLERFTLCGYSMGGRLALDFAVRHPERVERLVLVGASPGIADAAERAARARADAELADRIEAIGLEAFVDEWGAQPRLAGQPRGVAELAREDRLRNTAGGLAAALRGMGTGAMAPLWDRLPEATWVVGEHDAKFRALAPDPVVIPGAGHAAHLEAPDAVASVIAGGWEGEPQH
jgi:2-succinyl-6-hydroxy-2,4-cyclohexadiene-1-carboxylate synthase